MPKKTAADRITELEDSLADREAEIAVLNKELEDLHGVLVFVYHNAYNNPVQVREKVRHYVPDE